MANNDEKYLDGPGLTNVLQKQKSFNDDVNMLIGIAEENHILTPKEFKNIVLKGYEKLIKIGDCIDTGNGIAVVIGKNFIDDADGNTIYYYNNFSSATSLLNKGNRYKYMLCLIPKKSSYITSTTLYSYRKTTIASIPEIISLYNGIDSELKSVIEESVKYSSYLYYDNTKTSDKPRANDTYALKNKYYLQLADGSNYAHVTFGNGNWATNMNNARNYIAQAIKKFGLTSQYPERTYFALAGKGARYLCDSSGQMDTSVTSTSLNIDTGYQTAAYNTYGWTDATKANNMLLMPVFFIDKQTS